MRLRMAMFFILNVNCVARRQKTSIFGDPRRGSARGIRQDSLSNCSIIRVLRLSF